MSALINGKFGNRVDITDRALNYGDGVFRTVRIQQGKPLAWPAHWARLVHDCDKLYLPLADERLFLDDAAQLFADHASGVLKIIVSRGSGGRGYTPPADPAATRIVVRHPMPADGPQTLEVGVSDLRLARNSRLAGIKHLNRLEQVLAQRECRQRKLSELLMLDSEGWLVSATAGNVFLVSENRLVTPRLEHAGVIGATRQRILVAAAHAGIDCREQSVRLDDLADADEIFICNSVRGIRAIVSLDSQKFSHGPLTRWLRQHLEASD